MSEEKRDDKRYIQDKISELGEVPKTVRDEYHGSSFACFPKMLKEFILAFWVKGGAWLVDCDKLDVFR
jgi:hypothetical protein